MESVINTEERILAAARKVFTAKGFTGARMQDIADEARINKAMLHYYFRNKNMLFEMIFEEQLTKLLYSFQAILSSDLNLKDKLRDMIRREFALLHQYPELPIFILHEANRNPGLIEKKLKDKPVAALLSGFETSLKESEASGEIKWVDPKQLLINIMSLCIYPFIAKPMIKAVMQFDDKAYQDFLRHRPAMLTGMIWKSLAPK